MSYSPKKNDVIDKKTIVKVLFPFDVLHQSWELDSLGWIVQFSDKSKGIVMTSHSIPYVSNEKEIIDYLVNYKIVVKQIEKALDVLNGGEVPK
jgi:hypothetical protein